MIQQYYRKRWQASPPRIFGDDIARWRFFNDWIDLMCKEEPLTILDLGCGSGWMTNLLAKRWKTVGADVEIDYARTHYPDIQFTRADFLTDKLEGQHGAVVSSEVIEHIEGMDNKRIYVQKAYDMLRDGGYLFLTTPNRPVVKRMFDSIPRLAKQPVEDWLDAESLKALLNSVHFHVMLVNTTVAYPMWVRKSSYTNAAWLAFYNTIGYSLLPELNWLLSVFGFDYINWARRNGLYLTCIAQKY